MGLLHRNRVVARAGTILIPFVLAACLGGGGASYPEVEGRYQGTVVVEGQSIPGTLDLVQDGGALSATFSAPSLGLQAQGSGQVAPDGTARVQMEYNLQCPGVARLEGDFGAEGSMFRGSVTATDCTGELSGVFDFARRG